MGEQNECFKGLKKLMSQIFNRQGGPTMFLCIYLLQKANLEYTKLLFFNWCMITIERVLERVYLPIFEACVPFLGRFWIQHYIFPMNSKNVVSF